MQEELSEFQRARKARLSNFDAMTNGQPKYGLSAWLGGVMSDKVDEVES